MAMPVIASGFTVMLFNLDHGLGPGRFRRRYYNIRIRQAGHVPQLNCL